MPCAKSKLGSVERLEPNAKVQVISCTHKGTPGLHAWQLTISMFFMYSDTLLVSGCFHHVLWILEEAVTLLSSQRRRKQGELMEVMTAQNSLHTNAHENWLHHNMTRLKDHAPSCFSPPHCKSNHQLTWIIMIFTDPRQTGVMIGAQQFPS